MAAEIKKAIGTEVILVRGSGGIFEIRLNDNPVWKKERGGPFPADGEAAALFS